MISWIVRLLMIAAGAVTGWVVAEDAPNFGIIQMMVALVLLTLIVALLALGRPIGRLGSTACKGPDSKRIGLHQHGGGRWTRKSDARS